MLNQFNKTTSEDTIKPLSGLDAPRKRPGEYSDSFVWPRSIVNEVDASVGAAILGLALPPIPAPRFKK